MNVAGYPGRRYVKNLRVRPSVYYLDADFELSQALFFSQIEKNNVKNNVIVKVICTECTSNQWYLLRSVLYPRGKSGRTYQLGTTTIVDINLIKIKVPSDAMQSQSLAQLPW